MLLVDWSNVCVGQIIVSAKDQAVDMSFVRHLVLSRLLEYRKKYYTKYGELVICCDGRKTWRKEVFPEYKMNRKKTWDNMKIDKELLFKCINTMTEEINNTFRYKVIQIDGAEGDDIIATLCRAYHTEKNIIISADKDFIQLQQYGASQWSPLTKKMIAKTDPKKYLKEHIIRGDKGDGIPNFLSDGDTLVAEGKRQTPIKAKSIIEWMSKPPNKIYKSAKEQERWEMNELLINLDLIPADITSKILTEYRKEKSVSGDLLSYFIKHKLRHLKKSLGSF